VSIVFENRWSTQTFKLTSLRPNTFRIIDSASTPLRHVTKLNPTYDRSVRTKALMQSPEAWLMGSFVNGFPALAMIFEFPHFQPEGAVIRHDHPTLPSSGHNFVLAKRPAPI
jgi:hypothetical protein